MRVLLIYLDPLENEPIGLMYIGTILKRAAHTVKIIGIEKKNSERIFLREFRRFHPDVTGISITTPYANKAECIVRLIKDNFPGVAIIAGGPHPTILPFETLKSKNIDVCVIGEGERTIIEVIEHYAKKGLALEGIKGIAFLENNSLVMTERRRYIEDMDDLPFVDRELVPEEVFLGRAGYPLKNPCALITTVRGCPYHCTFCQPTVKAIFGEKVRRRSPENVVSEIRQLKESYHIGGLWINDDTFGFDHKWTCAFCELMIKSRMGIFWWANERINTVRRDILEKMQKAGCVSLMMTFECGSERVRNEILKKGVNNTQVMNAYNIVHDLGLITRTNIMLGSPTETEKELEETIEMVKAVQPHFVTASYTTPIPGTYMHSDFLSEGLLRGPQDWEFYDISHFKKNKSEVSDAKLKYVYKNIQRGYSGGSVTNRARHFFAVKNFRKILYQRWRSLLINKHPNLKHLLFDIIAIIVGSPNYFINRKKYSMKLKPKAGNLIQ